MCCIHLHIHEAGTLPNIHAICASQNQLQVDVVNESRGKPAWWEDLNLHGWLAVLARDLGNLPLLNLLLQMETSGTV